MISIFPPSTARAAEHEVTVWSFVTDHGRAFSAAAEDHAVCCRLFSGGYEKLGRVSSAPPSPAPEVEEVRNVLADGLQRAGFHPTYDSAPVEQMIVFRWGYMDPRRDEPMIGEHSRREWRAMLTVLGAGAAVPLDVERAALASALADDRYFLIVSAYDGRAFSATREQRLLWRTHMSVPARKLRHAQALPLLVGAGAALFNRETIQPRRILLPLRPNSVLRLKIVRH